MSDLAEIDLTRVCAHCRLGPEHEPEPLVEVRVRGTYSVWWHPLCQDYALDLAAADVAAPEPIVFEYRGPVGEFSAGGAVAVRLLLLMIVVGLVGVLLMMGPRLLDTLR